jgi:hypothetical protein
MGKSVIFKGLSNIDGEKDMRKKHVGNYMGEIHVWNKNTKPNTINNRAKIRAT